MKKYLSYTIALAAVLTVACNKENPSVDQPGKGNTGLRSFTAYVDGADSKTVFGESADGKTKSWWSGTESIKVLSQGQDPVSFKTDNLESATESAQFNIDENSTLAAGPWFAVYPHAANPSWTEGTTVTGLSLKAEQTAVEGGYDPANHFAIAYTDNSTLNFKNLVSFIKVTIDVDNISEICIFGNNAEKIAGEFTAEWNENEGKPTVSEGTLTYAKITNAGKNLAKGTYYVAVLPTNFTGGLTLEFLSNGHRYQKKGTKAINLKRNTILDLGTTPKQCEFAVTGIVFNNWSTEADKVLPLFDTDEDGIYEAKNVKLNKDNDIDTQFKFYSPTRGNGQNWMGRYDTNYKTGSWYQVYSNNSGLNTETDKGNFYASSESNWDIYLKKTASDNWGNTYRCCIVRAGDQMPEDK